MASRNSPPSPARIEIVDALRGFAMMGICLLHFVEHFDMGGRPAFPPAWLKPFDFWSNESAFFLFAGKSYSLFALLFGLSFYLLLDSASRRGEDFRLKFAWRLVLLYGIGFVHSLLFVGDFLTVIAVLGLPMVFMWRVPNRILWVMAGALLLIIPHCLQVGRIFFESGYAPGNFSPGRMYREVGPALLNGDYSDVFRVNLWLGHKAKWCWTLENGRYLQMLGLFILGLILGRSRIFHQPEKLARISWSVFLVCLVLLPALYFLKSHVGTLRLDRNSLRITSNLIGMHTNLIQMLGGSAFLVLLSRTGLGGRLIGLLVPYGRMSLSCYVSQAFIGVPLFYNFGLGMYRHMGSFYSLLAGVLFFTVHLTLAHLWLRYFHQGPLEWLWRCTTEWNFQRPFLRRAEEPQRDLRAA